MNKLFLSVFVVIIFCHPINAQKQKIAEIEQLTHTWAEANSSQSVARLEMMYAGSVNFYGINKDVPTCLSEKKAFFKRYPNYSISISNLDIDIYKSGIIRSGFLKNETWGDKPRNPQQGYLLFQKIDGDYKIIGESDQRVDTQRGYVPQLGEKVQKSSDLTYILIGAGAVMILSAIAYAVYKYRLQSKKIKSMPMLYSQQLGEGTKADIPVFSEQELKANNGLAFEQWVVKNFDPSYFKLINWRGDKYIDGLYPLSSHDPDLDYVYRDTARSESFAIECKWRQAFSNNTITIAEHRQLNNYRSYQHSKGYPVFIVLGVGGTGSNPQDIYIIPLEEIKNNIVRKDQLQKYYRYKRGRFFLEIPAMILQ